MPQIAIELTWIISKRLMSKVVRLLEVFHKLINNLVILNRDEEIL